eukprot:TRINITY_DN10655_c1_g1_i1.p1 TRINITY_DN10655_c1_g1~~TRINITY_DN10655_c1_g1_i1.p1  ORF type:complete len:422 (+),score=32.54 TRINITY_DN10655_c1_g1_i1:110-1267(+)
MSLSPSLVFLPKPLLSDAIHTLSCHANLSCFPCSLPFCVSKCLSLSMSLSPSLVFLPKPLLSDVLRIIWATHPMVSSRLSMTCRTMHSLSRERAEITRLLAHCLLGVMPQQFEEAVHVLSGLRPDIPAVWYRHLLCDLDVPVVKRLASHDNDGNSYPYHGIIIARDTQVGDGEYIDTIQNQIVSYNHVTGEAVPCRPLLLDAHSIFERYRRALDMEMDAYIKGHYYPSFMTRDGAWGTYSSMDKQGRQVLKVRILNRAYNRNNFWAGEWRSEWDATFMKGQDDDDEVKLCGKVQVRVHYFEDGNVQLHVNKVHAPPVLQGPWIHDEGALARTIADVITTTERNIDAGIHHQLILLDDTVFKAFRRAFPIRRSRFSSLYRVGREYY